MRTDGATLEQRLLERIRAEGPITFAAFMEAALYDPHHGFYARPPIGPAGDFVTSPHVSPAFGDLLARQLAECWELLGRPDPFVVAEAGAGDGTLARRIAEASIEPVARAMRYVAIERSPGALAALRSAGIEASERLPGPVHVVLANELLDNLPFHRLRERGGHAVEVLVGHTGERLVEVEGEPSPEALAPLDRPLEPGEERPVSPAALSFVDDIAAAVPRGYAFLIDYGFEPGERTGEVHSYRSHRVTGDVLAEPGSRDVTAAVDLGAIAARAARAGLGTWGPVSQRDALLGLGMRLWLRGLRARRADAEREGDHRLAMRLWGAISRASILVDEGKLGGLKVLVLGTEGLPAPAAALGDPETGC